jgi:hypothetical protein
MKALICLAFFMVLIAGCSDPTRTELRLAQMEGAQKKIEADLQVIRTAHTHFSRMVFQNEIDPYAQDLDITGAHFTWSRGVMGYYPVAVEQVIPYLDGFRLSVKVGNPYAAALAGELTCIWGPSPDLSAAVDQASIWLAYDRARALAKTNTFPLPKLLIGQWNKLDITLTPATPELVKKVTLKFNEAQVFLAD